MLSSAIHIILAAILCVFTITPPVTHTAAAQQEQLNNNNNSNNPIKHIVVIMQENHSFDNYFGTYPGANGIPENVCMPLDPDHPNPHSCVKPFLSTNATSPDMPHEYLPSHIAYNNGKMDGFMLAESENNSTMSYYDNKTIPYYWDLAKHYVLADNFFSSVLSYSLPNHWYAIAGQAPTASIYYGMPQKPTLATPNEKQVEKEYLQESNVTNTIADLFMKNNNTTTNVTWKYYYHKINADCDYRNATIKGAINSGQLTTS